jgi:hypothetical protein
MEKFQRDRILYYLQVLYTAREAQYFNTQTFFGYCFSNSQNLVVLTNPYTHILECSEIPFKQKFKNYSCHPVMYLGAQYVKYVSCPEHCTLLEVPQWNLCE